MIVRWTWNARNDLWRVADRIAEDDPAAALQLKHAIREATGQLAEFPRMGRPGRIEGTRELVIAGTPYLVPYRIEGEEVHLLGVLHGARMWPDDI